jgi:hypothetical protein
MPPLISVPFPLPESNKLDARGRLALISAAALGSLRT